MRIFVKKINELDAEIEFTKIVSIIFSGSFQRAWPSEIWIYYISRGDRFLVTDIYITSTNELTISSSNLSVFIQSVQIRVAAAGVGGDMF